MREIVCAERETPDALLRTGVPELDANVVAPALVRDETTGAAVCYVARYGGDLGGLRRALRAYPAETTLRMTGSRNPSRVFGYSARSELLRRNGCRVCGGATVAPDAHARICAATSDFEEQLLGLLPERHADLDAAKVIRPEWRIGGWWTSGVVNYDSPLPYHYDANNLPCWSAMVVVRRATTGGHLHIPAYDLVVDCRDGDVVYFPGHKLMHGVTPLRIARDGYRISAVYYTVAAMRRCGEPADELRSGQVARSEREDGLLDRQRASGLLDS